MAVLTSIFGLDAKVTASILIVGFAVTVIIGLAEIVDAIRESLPNRNTIHINCNREMMEQILKDASARILLQMDKDIKRELELEEHSQASPTEPDDDRPEPSVA